MQTVIREVLGDNELMIPEYPNYYLYNVVKNG
jgi:hypothetical protein